MAAPKDGASPGGLDATEQIRRVDALLRRRQVAEALVQCEALRRAHPGRIEGPMLLARARQMQGDFAAMLAAAMQARRIDPGHRLAWFLGIEALLHAGDVAGARRQLAELEAAAGEDPASWRRLSEFHTHLGQHESAARAARRLVALRPSDGESAYLLASALIAVGSLDEAEALLDELISRTPG